MADTVIETTGITEIPIVIARRVVGMRRTVIVTEGIIGIGETAGVHPQLTEVVEDTPPNIGAGEAIQEAHQEEGALVAIGSQTARVGLANRQQMVRIRDGEVGAIAGGDDRNWFDTQATLQNARPIARPTIVLPCQVCFLSCDCFASVICLSLLLKMCKPSPAMQPFLKVCFLPCYLLIC